VIAFLLSPLGRWVAVGAVCAALAGWATLERAGRQAARAGELAAVREANGLREVIRRMETRNAVDDGVRRERDPVGELRREFGRD
jgi:hypothetical protein